MSTILNITLPVRNDRASIGTGAGLVLAVANAYNGDLSAEAEIDVSAMDADTLEAFKKVVDHITYAFEATYPVVKVAYDDVAKEFDLTASYLRSAVSTASPAALADGTPILMRVEFPGFEANTFVEAELPYNEAITLATDDALKAAGITFTGTGALFTIENERECKIYFSKPAAVSGKYVIDYPAQETIIPAE